MQAAIGKEQLKKFNFILKENKKRYEILNKTLKQYGKIRVFLINHHQFMILSFLSQKKIKT